MNIMSKVIGAIGGLALSAAASAAPINVGGVVWDPDDAQDFFSGSLIIHQDIDAVTGVVSGYGLISSINGTEAATFCPGCELTFVFGGFIPIGATILPSLLSGGTSIDYKDGWVNFYVDHGLPDAPPIGPADATSLTLGNTSDGALWLGLTGHNDSVTGTAFNGTVVPAVPLLAGVGALDVAAGAAGGMAAGNFDTNTKGDGADFAFVSGFTSFPLDVTPGNALTDAELLSSNGTANLDGDSIPEPGSVALFGAGLLAFGLRMLGRRRKSSLSA